MKLGGRGTSSVDELSQDGSFWVPDTVTLEKVGGSLGRGKKKNASMDEPLL